MAYQIKYLSLSIHVYTYRYTYIYTYIYLYLYTCAAARHAPPCRPDCFSIMGPRRLGIAGHTPRKCCYPVLLIIFAIWDNANFPSNKKTTLPMCCYLFDIFSTYSLTLAHQNRNNPMCVILTF